MRIEFSGPWPLWLVIVVAIVGAGLLWRWYRRESQFVRQPWSWVLPTLRAIALVMILLMLSGPSIRYQSISGELSRVQLVLDLSSSMAISDKEIARSVTEIGANDQGKSRLDQVRKWLMGGGENEPGWLSSVRSDHRIEIEGLLPDHKARLWDSLAEEELPKANEWTAIGNGTPLASALSWKAADGRSPTEARDSVATDKKPSVAKQDAAKQELGNIKKPAAIVLVSDGQSNIGVSPADIAKILANEQVPVFCVGVGQSAEPVDLGIVKVEHSQRVFRTDRLRGVIYVKERIPAGEPYVLTAMNRGKAVWRKELISSDAGSKRVDFEVEAELLVDDVDALAAESQAKSTPIDLEFVADVNVPEISKSNNRYASALWGVVRKNKVLVLDVRGRWELRYINNALQRDPSWDVESHLGPKAFEKSFFPVSRNALFQFDLLILTLDSVSRLNATQQNWVSEFVASSGGGLVLVDSGRDSGTMDLSGPLKEVIPFVDHKAIDPAGKVDSLSLSNTALEQPAFLIDSDRDRSMQIWKQLPAPRSPAVVTPSVGSEVLMTATLNEPGRRSDVPLLISRYYGQGRVLYSASDETWRWRYNVADLYHQRFWNQIAQWSMRMPFAVKNDFVSLDSGARLYEAGSEITIRARIKEETTLTESRSVNAVIIRDGVRVGTSPLTEDTDVRGYFSATTSDWPTGEYRIALEAVGIPTDVLQIETSFRVLERDDIESQTLACNETLLKEIATTTGGAYFALSDADQLQASLQKYRTGRIEQYQWLLWQSYPWFVTIVLLLAAEWYLRKQVGLM